jgi:hypothetical protein
VAVIYDDDFQSYTLGANPPYGSLVAIGVVPATIADAVAGLYGDAQYVDVPGVRALQYPTATPTHLLPYYQQFSVFRGLLILPNATSENGVILQFYGDNAVDFSAALATIKVLADGTLALTDSSETAFYAVSDFSLLCNSWHWLQVNIAFGQANGFITYAIEIAVNGISVLTANVTTNVDPTPYGPYLYCNYIVLGGAGTAGYLGRLTITDVIQPIGTDPHPGTPVAKVSQGVIELITSTVPGPPAPPGPPPGPPTPMPAGCAETSKLGAAPVISAAGTAAPSIPGQTNSLKSQL